MEFRSRLGLAFVLLGCFLGLMLALDTFGGAFFPAGDSEAAPGTLLDEVFTRAGFTYGPQEWRPGYDPLGIYPGLDVNVTDRWYLMFVDLNATPVSGDPDVRKVGAVRVTYNFTGLAGRAVFHAYGLSDNSRMPTRTTRQTGFGSCGYVVTGNTTAGSSMPAATPLDLPADRQYEVAVANGQLESAGDFTAETRIFSFPQQGGMGALHITPDLSKIKGMITETPALDGSFYVAATGNDPGSDLVLLVAVDRPQPDAFALRLRTEFIRTG